MTAPNIRLDAWNDACVRYKTGLSIKEQVLFENATFENLLEESQDRYQTHETRSQWREASRKLAPLLDQISTLGKALDVYANACPSILSPLWGSIRVFLCVRQKSFCLSSQRHSVKTP